VVLVSRVVPLAEAELWSDGDLVCCVLNDGLRETLVFYDEQLHEE